MSDVGQWKSISRAEGERPTQGDIRKRVLKILQASGDILRLSNYSSKLKDLILDHEWRFIDRENGQPERFIPYEHPVSLDEDAFAGYQRYDWQKAGILPDNATVSDEEALTLALESAEELSMSLDNIKITKEGLNHIDAEKAALLDRIIINDETGKLANKLHFWRDFEEMPKYEEEFIKQIWRNFRGK